MRDWFDELWESLVGRRPRARRPLLHRRISLSGQTLAWLRSPARSEQDRLDFAHLLLQLDADPIGCSHALLGADLPPGLRWVGFGDHVALFTVDAGNNRIRVLTCHAEEQGQ